MNPQQQTQAEPELRRTAIDPKGVLQKNLKPLVYLGAALLVILAAVFSSHTKKTPAQEAAARHEPPQPTVQDNTDNNVADLKNQLAAEKQKEAEQAALVQASGSRPHTGESHARAASRRSRIQSNWPARSLRSRPALPAGERLRTTERRSTAAHAGAAAGPATCRQRA